MLSLGPALAAGRRHYRPISSSATAFRQAQMDQTLAWNRQRGCDTVAGLNEIVRSGKIKAAGG